MPICSYLVHPMRGKKDALALALGALPGCEVIPAANYEVLVLVTDTPHEDAERALQTALDGLPDLQSLTLVAGVDPDTGERQEASHDAP
jgi:nitrate reductase NapAB chaperone NapD